MPGDLPNRTTVGTRAGDAFNRLRETLRSHAPGQSVGVRTSHTVHGIYREADEVAAGYGAEPAAAVSGMIFRGLWSNVASYSAQHVVFRTPTGGAAGAYVGLEDNIPVGTLPESGAPWWSSWPYPPPGVWG